MYEEAPGFRLGPRARVLAVAGRRGARGGLGVGPHVAIESNG